MKRSIDKFNFHKLTSNFRGWVSTHQFQLAIFNLFVMLLVLLRSAGYFDPFFPITINLIFISALATSIFLLGTNSSGAAVIALVFWILAGVLKLLNIGLWAERSALYSFEALVISVLLFIIESAAIPLRLSKK